MQGPRFKTYLMSQRADFKMNSSGSTGFLAFILSPLLSDDDDDDDDDDAAADDNDDDDADVMGV